MNQRRSAFLHSFFTNLINQVSLVRIILFGQPAVASQMLFLARLECGSGQSHCQVKVVGPGPESTTGMLP